MISSSLVGNMADSRARSGWDSDFPAFKSAQPADVRKQLEAFIADASPGQVRAWRDSIPPLQREVEKTLVRDVLAAHYSAIRLDHPEDVSWYNGPPYAVAETVFDEYDLGGCQLDLADT